MPTTRSRQMNRLLLAVVVLILAALPLISATPEFWLTHLNYIGLASLVVLGLVLLTGIGGLTFFGQADFVGIGAYTTRSEEQTSELQYLMRTSYAVFFLNKKNKT